MRIPAAIGLNIRKRLTPPRHVLCPTFPCYAPLAIPACVHPVQAHAGARGLEGESGVATGTGYCLLGGPPYSILRHWRGEREE